MHDLTVLLCAESGFTPNIVSLTWEMAVILFTVESGVAVSIIPGTCREIAGRDVRIIELETPRRYFDVLIAWKKNDINTSIPVFVNLIDSLSSIKLLRRRSEVLKN